MGRVGDWHDDEDDAAELADDDQGDGLTGPASGPASGLVRKGDGGQALGGKQPRESGDADDLGDGLGLRCPRCNSAWSRVTRTVRLTGVIRRERVCQHCGRRFFTTELPGIKG